MTDDDKDLDELFAPLREGARDPGGHPTSAELAAYHAKELSPADDLRVREHIVVCRECADLVLDLQAFYDAGREEPSEVTDFEQVAAWRDLREKLPFRADDTLGTPKKAERRRPGFFAPLRSLRGIAAVLAVVAVSGVLAYRLREPARSQVVTLDPVSSFRSGEKDEGETASPSDDLVLRVAGESYKEYQAEIRREGEVIETLSGLREDEPSNVPIGSPGSSLEPGRYEIVLFGLGSDSPPEEIGTYEILFKAP